MAAKNYVARKTTLQHASARMLNRYAPWMEYMLTITFGKGNLQLLPDEENAKKQVRHMSQALNSAIWGHKSRKNERCNILYVPIIEGGTEIKRVHSHILLGNVKSDAEVHCFMRGYIPKSNWIAPDYDVTPVNMTDGACWYVSKELDSINDAAIAWDIAAIPRPLLPR